MPRTTPEKVRAVIDTNPQEDLNQFIGTANNVTAIVADADTNHILSDELLVDIETYLAAHFYALKDPQYVSKSTGGASASYQTSPKGKGLLATDWGQQAIALDITGKLAAISQGSAQVGILWLGKPVSAQVDYLDRN